MSLRRSISRRKRGRNRLAIVIILTTFIGTLFHSFLTSQDTYKISDLAYYIATDGTASTAEANSIGESIDEEENVDFDGRMKTSVARRVSQDIESLRKRRQNEVAMKQMGAVGKRRKADPFGLRKKKPYRKHGSSQLDTLRLIGERHSGTTFITNTLAACFPTINLQNTLLAHKHWFQPSPDYLQRMSAKYGKDGMMPSNTRYGLKYTWFSISEQDELTTVFNSTYVIVMFRDPYDWMEAMRLKPHHWPNHQDYKLNKPRQQRDEREGGRVDGEQDDESDYFGDNIDEEGLEEAKTERARIRDLHRRERIQEVARAKKMKNHPKSEDDSRRRLQMKRGRRQRPNFVSVPLSWQEFVQTPLTLGSDSGQNPDMICQKGADHGRISPCTRTTRYVPREVVGSGLRGSAFGFPANANDPVYEHRKDGSLFDHPLEMREQKIVNFLNLTNEWEFGGFLPLQYEKLVKRGMKYLVDLIAREFDVEPICKPDNLRDGQYKLEPGFEKWITENADWDVEKLIGYVPR